MSSLALEARQRGLAKWHRPRTADESRAIYIEIVRAAGQESYRSMARRLGVAHSYCRRVAIRYHGGEIPARLAKLGAGTASGHKGVVIVRVPAEIRPMPS